MRKKTLTKRKNKRRQEALLIARGAFTRLKNRGVNRRQQDFINAGYPSVLYTGTAWNTLHELCKTTFVDAQGRPSYTWFGNTFYFLSEEDIHVFRTLQYLV